MAHIHTQPNQHDHTVGAYVLRTDLDELKILLHRHKKHGWYMQFGGHIELDENPWQAIVHELKEESGYEIDQLLLLQPENRLAQLTNATVHPYPVVHSTHDVGEKHFHTDSGYAFITQQVPHHQPAQGESQELRLFTKAEIRDLPNSEILENIREIILYIFDECLPHWQPIQSNKFH